MDTDEHELYSICNSKEKFLSSRNYDTDSHSLLTQCTCR